MRAAYCIAPGRFEVREVADPTPGSGDVIVRVHRCGICGSDLHYFHGGFPPPLICPGHEIAGEIVAAGADTTMANGTRVAVEPLVVCGRCSYCRTGNYQLCVNFCIVGNSVDGGFAEFVRVPGSAVFPLPDAVDLDVGTLTEPLAVAVHALRLARPEMGDRVLVLGAGTIGLMSVAAARAAGAADVWITARHDHQSIAATALGATRVFSGAEADSELTSAARRQPVDIVVETVGGRAETLGTALQAVRPAGQVIVLGLFTEPIALDATSMVVKEVRLTGSMTYGRSGTRADFERALDILGRAPEKFRGLNTHWFGLHDIGSAFEVAADKRSGAIKVSVAPGARCQAAGM